MKRTIEKDMTEEPVTISSRVSIREAQEIMQTWGMRHLPVLNDDNELIGIVSDRDFSRTFMTNLKGHDSVTEIMTSNPYSVTPDTSIQTVVQAMAQNKFGCVVVTTLSKEVLGIFTTTDALQILSRLLREPGNDSYKVLRIDDYFKHHRALA